MRALVAGAGGALGGHLVKRLVEDGHDVRAVDIKRSSEWFQAHEDSSIWEVTDLRDPEAAHAAVGGIDWAFNFACDMGGVGYITEHRADCMSSVLINTNLLRAARDEVERYFFASSACIYSAPKQLSPEDGFRLLKEEDDWPWDPEKGYGEEKFFSEYMTRYAGEDWGFETRIARFHNVYSPLGTWRGGREKAPAAIARKVAEAVHTQSGEISVWGDGAQTRSFLYIHDLVEGVLRIMGSDYALPLNLGSEEVVTIDELIDITEECAGLLPRTLHRQYDLDAPQGVRGRGSDNALLRKVTGWEPSVSLRDGMKQLYEWVEEQVRHESS